MHTDIKIDENQKYYFMRCSCGHVHKIPVSELKDVFSTYEELFVVCLGCGKVKAIGKGYNFEQDRKTAYERDVNVNLDSVIHNLNRLGHEGRFVRLMLSKGEVEETETE